MSCPLGYVEPEDLKVGGTSSLPLSLLLPFYRLSGKVGREKKEKEAD